MSDSILTSHPLDGRNDLSIERLQADLHHQLLEKLDMRLVGATTEQDLHLQVRSAAEQLVNQVPGLTWQERSRLLDGLLQEILGFGPLDLLLSDPAVTDVLVNGPDCVFVERYGRLVKTEIRFRDRQQLIQIIQRVCAGVGRRVDESSPIVDARMPDGSRFNAILPPLALRGPYVSIRRFGKIAINAATYLATDSATQPMLTFLEACVRARLNLLISGGTGSGKTTLLNLLSGYIQTEQRVATIEDAAELQLQQPHVVSLETRPPNIEGKGEVTARDLVKNALRMRPDRIIVGESRGGEAFDMLQAMNTGHAGSMTTIHANSPLDAVMRLEMLVGLAGLKTSPSIIRRLIASAIQIVVQIARLPGGARKIVSISELRRARGERIVVREIFAFRQTAVDSSGNARGHFTATGTIPACLPLLAAAGIELPADLFAKSTEETQPARSAAPGS